jgi:hypothetical protein
VLAGRPPPKLTSSTDSDSALSASLAGRGERPELLAEQGRRTEPAFLAMQGLRVTGLVGDIELGPGVLAAEHEVAGEWGRGVVAEGEDDGACETRCFREQLAVGVEVGAAASELLVDRLELAEPPGRVGVAGGRGTECEALGVQRALRHRLAA